MAEGCRTEGEQRGKDSDQQSVSTPCLTVGGWGGIQHSKQRRFIRAKPEKLPPGQIDEGREGSVSKRKMSRVERGVSGRCLLTDVDCSSGLNRPWSRWSQLGDARRRALVWVCWSHPLKRLAARLWLALPAWEWNQAWSRWRSIQLPDLRFWGATVPVERGQRRRCDRGVRSKFRFPIQPRRWHRVAAILVAWIRPGCAGAGRGTLPVHGVYFQWGGRWLAARSGEAAREKCQTAARPMVARQSR